MNLATPGQMSSAVRAMGAGVIDDVVIEAARMLRERKIDELPVVDADGRPVGMVDVQDILDVGLA